MATDVINIPSPPWHAAYPAPKNQEPASMTRDTLLEMIKNDGRVAGRDFVLVDLRRVDHEVRDSVRPANV
jgi:arsenical-resistance protein 2